MSAPQTRRPYCIHLCGRDAVEMVGPYSLCAEHAAQERAERAADRARIAAFMASPEMQAETRRENALEASAS